MPSLIRLVVVLLVLAGIGYGGMIALTMAVDPGEKEMSYRIPSRDLWAEEGAAPALIPTP
jgi:hypothetical protein